MNNHRSIYDRLNISAEKYYSKPFKKDRLKYSVKQAEAEYENLKNSLIESITVPFYHCRECKYETEYKKEMIQHYVNEHSLRNLNFPNKHPYDFYHIILEHLIDTFIESKGKRYIKVSNMKLWSWLCFKLDLKPSDKDCPSKQTPRHILNKANLLNRGKREKSRIGYNSKGNRVYHINIKDLEKAVADTEFYDLHIKIGILDYPVEPSPIDKDEPTSSTCEKNQKEENDTGETGESKLSDFEI